MQETKILHQKKKNLSKIQIVEFSILFIILNYFQIASAKIEELEVLQFTSEKNEKLKNVIIKSIIENKDENSFKSKIENDHVNVIQEINENSNIQLITKGKNDQEILELLHDLILDLKEQNNLKKIESLEKKLINNLDENSYSELIKLKSQINGE